MTSLSVVLLLLSGIAAQDPAKESAEMEALARACACEIAWRFDAKAALEEASKEQRPVFVYVRCIDQDAALSDAQSTLEASSVEIRDDGLCKDLLMRAGPLSDPDVIALIQRRFIPLMMTYDLSSHGQGPSPNDPLQALRVSSADLTTPAVLILAPDGKLVHRLHRMGTLSGPFLDRFLIESLKDSGGLKPRSDGGPLELFEAGDLERLIKQLLTSKKAEDRLLLSRALLRLFRVDEAEKALASSTSAEALLQKGRIALSRGDYAKALEWFEKAEIGGDQPAREMCTFWSSWCKRFLGREKEAEQGWKEIVGPTLFGRRAAMMLLTTALDPALAQTTVIHPWPEKLPEETEGRDPQARFDAARSISLLLEMQHENGRFCGHEGWRGNGFSDAGISALSGLALVRWRARVPPALQERVDGALKKLDSYLQWWSGLQPPIVSEAFHDPYVLMYLLGREHKAACEKLILRIAGNQNPDGNWTVYQVERPASFNTALNVMALARAKSSGHEVPPSVLNSGIKALEAMRTKEGLFPYSTMQGHEWMTTAHASIGRDPLCEHALLVAGRKTAPNITRALDRFLKFHHELRTPTKKYYDYFNSRGHGGYYFFFAHFHAQEAALTMAETPRKKYLEAIRREVLAAQEFDGTWIDKTLLGRAYGTAMALNILAER